MVNELSMLAYANHPNITRVFELMEDSTAIFIVSEHISGGNLLDRLTEGEEFSEDQVSAIVKQLLAALSHMENSK
jgi:serine/threonine protein kinase